MSVEPRRVTKTEVWVGWENQVVNGVYPLRRFLGGSNHSAVFLTEYRAEGVPNAAIKLVPADSLETEAQLVQWGTAATLTHPHLVRLFDVGRCHLGGRGFLFVVMEYADQTLAQILPRRALSPDETRELLLPTLSALGFLHRNNLVQGQLKPTNLLVINDQLKLASDTIRSTGKLSSGILRASLYDPPELKDGEIAAAGDVWGLGITLVEALTQHPPSWPDPRSETVALTASIPPLFVDTVQRCLNRTPANRPTVAELEGQFNPAVHAHPITVIEAAEPVYEVANVDPEPPPAPSKTSSGTGVLVPAIAAVLVLALAVWVSRTIFSSTGSRVASAPVVTRPVANEPIASRQVESPQDGSQQVAASRISRSPTGPRNRGSAAAATDDAPADATVSPSASEGTVGSQQVEEPQRSAESQAPLGVPRASDPTLVAFAGGSRAAPVAGSTAGSAATSGAPVAGSAAAPAAGSAAAPVALGSRQPAAPTAQPSSNTAQPSAATARASSTGPQSSPEDPEVLGSVLHQKLPDVPRPIREKIRGHVNVSVRVLVDPAGNVVGEFFESAGPSRYFARLAGDAAGEWKFVPTDAHGSRVWQLRFEFTRAGVTVRTIGTQ
ncbi:MAG TPA: protein kinase [Steroidobacteraceae bacterium]|nr:protein kinase [Steroidobacteraceae bacterium]